MFVFANNLKIYKIRIVDAVFGKRLIHSLLFFLADIVAVVASIVVIFTIEKLLPDANILHHI